MNRFKSILISTFGFLALGAATIGFSSCEHDSCTVLNCQNGGRCEDGVCVCPEGYEGAECNETLANKYSGTYGGSVRCNTNELLFPIRPDTVILHLQSQPNKIRLEMRAGNTTITNQVIGTARGSNIEFERFETPSVSIDATAKMDGNLINIHLLTINKITNEKQSCSFIGKRHITVVQ